MGGEKRPLEEAGELKPLGPIQARDPNKIKLSLAVASTKSYLDLETISMPKLKKIAVDALDGANFQDEDTDMLRNRIEEAFAKHTLEEIIIGVTGPMGIGKSTLLNNIFSIGSVARAGDGSMSCTLSSQKFSGPLPGQTSKFLAKIIFFEPDERDEILAGLLKDWYNAKPSGPDVEEEDQHEGDSDIQTQVETTLFSMLKGQPECKDLPSVKQFLDTAKSEADESVLRQLQLWTFQLIDARTNDGNDIVIMANDRDELMDELDEFATQAQKPTNKSVFLAPMVSLVSIHFKDIMLPPGVSFMDTPGLSDPNRARQKSASIHSPTITHMIVVEEMKRATDDAHVVSRVSKFLHLGPNRVVLAFTKADSFEGDQAQFDERDDKLKHRKLLRQKEELDRKASEFGPDSDPKSHMDNEIMLKTVTNAIEAMRMRVRNESTLETLLAKLDGHSNQNAKTVPILFIGNAHYALYVKGCGPLQAPSLSYEDTNVPRLRQQIASFPHDELLRYLHLRQESHLPHLYAQLRAWTSGQQIEAKAQLQAPIEGAKGLIRKAIDGVLDSLHNNLTIGFVGAIEDEEPSWTIQMAKLCETWCKTEKNSPFMKLMNKGGTRGVGTVHKSADLNADLCELKQKFFEQLCATATTTINTSFTTLGNDIDRILAEMIKEMEAIGAAAKKPVNLRPFVVGLDTLKPQLLSARRSVCEALVAAVSEFLGNVINTNPKANPMVSRIHDIYKEIAKMTDSVSPRTELPPKGKSKAKRYAEKSWIPQRKPKFTDLVTNKDKKSDGIWMAARDLAEETVNESISKQKKAFHKKADKFGKKLDADFNLVFKKTEPTEKELKAREFVKKSFKEFEKVLLGEMVAHMNNIDADAASSRPW